MIMSVFLAYFLFLWNLWHCASVIQPSCEISLAFKEPVCLRILFSKAKIQHTISEYCSGWYHGVISKKHFIFSVEKPLRLVLMFLFYFSQPSFDASIKHLNSFIKSVFNSRSMWLIWSANMFHKLLLVYSFCWFCIL